PVKLVYDRLEDMWATTKRHPSRTTIRSGFTKDGRLVGLHIAIEMDGGAYVTLTPVVLSRGTLHAGGAGRCAHVTIQSPPPRSPPTRAPWAPAGVGGAPRRSPPRRCPGRGERGGSGSIRSRSGARTFSVSATCCRSGSASRRIPGSPGSSTTRWPRSGRNRRG